MAKTLALIIGIVFLVVGLLGLFSNPIVGDMGYFMANMAHNIVHLVTGLIFLLVVSRSPSKSAMTMKIFGIIYLIVAGLGFWMAPMGGDLLGFITVNAADNWLHLVLGVVILVAGLSTKDSQSSM